MRLPKSYRNLSIIPRINYQPNIWFVCSKYSIILNQIHWSDVPRIKNNFTFIRTVDTGKAVLRGNLSWVIWH